MHLTTTVLTLGASREAVWDALTLAELVRRWEYGSALETNWDEGSPIRYVAHFQGRVFEQWGTVRRVERPSYVEYSLFAPREDLEDRPENYFTMTYELAERDGGTELTITHADPRPGAPEGSFIGDPDDPVLVALRAVVEGGAS